MSISTSIIPLRDLCDNFKQDIVDGPFGSNMKRSDYVEDGIPVLKIQNIKPFAITHKKMDYVSEVKYVELKRHSYKTGDIIMTKLGDPLGASAIVNLDEEGLIVADLVRIRAAKVNTKYLCYHLNSPVTQGVINAQQKGATRPRVKIANVRDLPIYTPSVEKQKKIVAILDQAFDAIDQVKFNIERNLQNTKELFQSKLNEIFSQKGEGWEEKKLGDILSLEYGKALSQEERVSDGLYPVYGANGIKNRTNNFYVDELSLIVGRKGSAGEINYTESKFWPLDVTYFTKFDKNVLELDFLYYLLMMHNLPSLAKGVKPGINRNDVYAIDVFIPSCETQKEVVLIMNALNIQVKKLEESYKTKLSNLAELKKSILQKAFTNKLVS